MNEHDQSESRQIMNEHDQSESRQIMNEHDLNLDQTGDA